MNLLGVERRSLSCKHVQGQPSGPVALNPLAIARAVEVIGYTESLYRIAGADKWSCHHRGLDERRKTGWRDIWVRKDGEFGRHRRMKDIDLSWILSIKQGWGGTSWNKEWDCRFREK